MDLHDKMIYIYHICIVLICFVAIVCDFDKQNYTTKNRTLYTHTLHCTRHTAYTYRYNILCCCIMCKDRLYNNIIVTARDLSRSGERECSDQNI